MLGKIILLIVAFLVLWAIVPYLTIPAAIIVAIAIFIFIQYNYCFTFIEEGTCKIVMRGAEFREAMMTWQDKVFKIEKEGRQQKEADNWDIVDGKPVKHIFGGLRHFTWIPFLDKIDIRMHRWAHVHEDGRIAQHEEKQDFSMLKPDMYAFEIPLSREETEESEEEGEEEKGVTLGGKEQGAEDINGIPLAVAVGLPMQMHNPYIATFLVRRWYSMIATIVKIRLRQFVAVHTYSELLPMHTHNEKNDKSLWEEFWKDLEKDFEEHGAKINDKTIGIYGMEIIKKGAGLIRIDPSKKYRDATTKQYMAEQDKKVTIIGAEAEAKAITIKAIAQAKAARNTAKQKSLESGDMYKRIRENLIANCNLPKTRADELAADFTKYWKGTEEKAITDWRFTGADGSVLAEIAKIVGVAQISKQKTTEKPKEKVADKPQKTP